MSAKREKTFCDINYAPAARSGRHLVLTEDLEMGAIAKHCDIESASGARDSSNTSQINTELLSAVSL